MNVNDVEYSIKDLGNEFENRPLDFTVESSLVAELQKIMRDKNKNNKIQVNAEYKDFDEDKYEENYTNYKEKYLKRICNQDEINQVQMEVNIGEPLKEQGEGKNKLIDLAVLRENTEIRLIKGTKYFISDKSIQHAIEVKYIKNKNIAPKNIVDFFKRDLEKLMNIKSVKSRHLVIFSNKNIFQRKKEDDIKEDFEDSKYTGKAQDRFEELDGKYEEIEIYHFFPLID